MRSMLVLLCVMLALPAVAADQVKPDPLLAQPVTIECINVRLHTALAAITQATGVTIYSGRVTGDWQDRDIPVIVCARDVALGRLLQAIADSTHMILSHYVDSKGQHTYRIWRDKNRRDDLANYYSLFDRTEIDRACYDWDLWARLKDLPDPQTKTGDKPDPRSDYYAQRMAEEKVISSLIAAQGPDARDKVLDGESLRVTVKTAPQSIRDALASYFRDNWRRFGGIPGANLPHSEMSDEDLARSNVSIYYTYSRLVMDKSRDLQVEAFVGDRYGVPYDSDSLPRVYGHAKVEIPPRPKMPEAPAYRESGAEYTRLDPEQPDAPLREKFAIDAWKGKATPTYGDLIAVASKATGYTIVAEDFDGQMLGRVLSRLPEIKGFFGRKSNLAEVLAFAWGPQWRVHKDAKLIVGPEKNWPEHLRNLVPESTIAGLIAKLNRDGVQLADLEPLAKLPRPESAEWIYTNPRLAPLSHATALLAHGSTAWQIYFALKPAEREKAMDKDGVTLNYLNKDWLASRFREMNKSRAGWVSEADPSASSKRKDLDLLSNPETMPSLRLRLVSSERGGKRSYLVYVDGPGINLVDNLSGFPIYSPERQAELNKKSAPETKK